MGSGTTYSHGTTQGAETIALGSSHYWSHTHGYTSSSVSADHAHTFGSATDYPLIYHYHTFGDYGHTHTQQVAANPGCGGSRYSDFRADSSGWQYPQNINTFAYGAGSAYSGYTSQSHNHGAYSYGQSANHSHAMATSTGGKLTSNNADLPATPTAHANLQPILVLKHIIKV